MAVTILLFVLLYMYINDNNIKESGYWGEVWKILVIPTVGILSERPRDAKVTLWRNDVLCGVQTAGAKQTR